MTFGEFWPDPALQRAANANWHALERIGGGMVAALRHQIDEHQRLADEALARGDRETARRHDEEVDDLFGQLEDLLAYAGGAR
ncbi:hypothetical protein [Magnetospirillum sp. 64-120]|uniref:hypothetical protein n=1 Tax=Magnetospirillum sp. 64-120 TaxID=1895778 RepID=UPI00092C0C58|nr:hypothetical protein [Magnetospirillum sp. 64-120]OJX65825.1 MAG: hypothetical protein BGO92_06940 [Magnetospirillum sp. 64-120]